MIVGDAVIGNPPGQLSLLRDKLMDDPAQLRASVGRLLDLKLEAVVLGDGVSILEDARKKLEHLVASFSSSRTMS